MHILVVNDDGPPSQRLSPYIRPLVDELHAAGHLVSVVVPAASRSWIGKAHLIEAPLAASVVHPDSFREDGTWDTEAHPRPREDGAVEKDDSDEWVVVANGTPASCTQLGLYHLFPTRPPVDLVLAGPNHGRNASTVYNLSSGTVGGALEAVLCGKRAIALSFGSKDAQPSAVVRAAARLAVRLVAHLVRNWDPRVELYNVNVPMRPDVESRPVRYTHTLPYYLPRGCLYAEMRSDAAAANGVSAKEPRCNGATVNGHADAPRRPERHFKWSADLSDMKKSLLSSEEGTDAHTVLNGSTSVTALRANFWHVPGLDGLLDLDH